MMLKAMISHRFKRCTVFLCTFLLVSYAGFSAAAPPEFAGDKGFPQYVEGEFDLVKQMLEENAAKLDRNARMMDALSTQLSGVEANLKAEIVLAKREINAKVDLLAQDVEDVLFILNEPDKDIQLTTEVCFDLGASLDYSLAGKVVGGLGWDAGPKVELAVEYTGPITLPVPSPIPGLPLISVPIPAVSVGVGNTVCINVPLYSVASNTLWIEDFDTEAFDSLIAGAAMPGQFLLPGLAHAFGQVMPTIDGAIGSLTSSLGVFDPNQTVEGQSFLLANTQSVDKSVLYAASASHEDMILDSPLLSNIMATNSFADAVGDPCGFAASLNLPGADALLGTCKAGDSAVNLFLDLIDPLCILDPLHRMHCKS